MYQNFFFTAPSHQNCNFTDLLVENISFISVLSKFTFQLNDDKRYDYSHDKIRYFLNKSDAQKLSSVLKVFKVGLSSEV